MPRLRNKAKKRDPFEIQQLKPFPGPKGTVKNPDGTSSSERTVTFEVEGKHRIAPTLVFDKGPKGKQLTPKQAVERAAKIGFKKFPSFSSQKEAEKFAAERTKLKGYYNK